MGLVCVVVRPLGGVHHVEICEKMSLAKRHPLQSEEKSECL